MKTAMIGATGRTGRHALTTALDRGHDVKVLVRNPERLAEDVRQRVDIVVGDSTDPSALATLLDGVDAVLSALGPSQKQPDLHTRTAHELAALMRVTGPRRFVGVSGAGIDVPGDEEARRDKVISWLINALGGDVVKDKPAEYKVWADSGLDWTLVRPPRLVEGPATGRLEHDAHRSTQSTRIHCADLGTFLVDILEGDLYVQKAPFVATTRGA